MVEILELSPILQDRGLQLFSRFSQLHPGCSHQTIHEQISHNQLSYLCSGFQCCTPIETKTACLKGNHDHKVWFKN